MLCDEKSILYYIMPLKIIKPQRKKLVRKNFYSPFVFLQKVCYIKKEYFKGMIF